MWCLIQPKCWFTIKQKFRSMNSGYGFAQKEDDYPENRLNGKWYADVMGKKWWTTRFRDNVSSNKLSPVENSGVCIYIILYIYIYIILYIYIMLCINIHWYITDINWRYLPYYLRSIYIIRSTYGNLHDKILPYGTSMNWNGDELKKCNVGPPGKGWLQRATSMVYGRCIHSSMM